MGRCKKERCCRELGGSRLFKPRGVPGRGLDINNIEIDEFEAMRLCDLEGKSQIEAAEAMGVSRGTIQRLLIKGRKKVVESLLNNKGILIEDKE
ncbi:DUF134 domain-containing protein [Propionigenium maris]|uniref:DUF134 domain-containing protein n=1 Tax=Propionigenium maris TaxID=45622 RepID=UPI002493B299|nr:DUF134 domain-containing protein [Propionigenium maris]